MEATLEYIGGPYDGLKEKFYFTHWHGITGKDWRKIGPISDPNFGTTTICDAIQNPGWRVVEYKFGWHWDILPNEERCGSIKAYFVRYK